MRKLLVLPLLCGMLLSGCIRVSTLQDLAVIQGVGVDHADGQYQLTLQVFSAEGSGGQTILDPSKQNAQTITCSGPTVAEALSRTSLSQGRTFFLGHDRLLILGEGTRALPLSDLLEELTGSLSLREDVVVLAADGKAADVLAADVNQGVLPAMTIEQTVENAAKEGRIPDTRLLELSRSLTEKHRSTVMPVIALPETAEGDLKTFTLSGAAVYAADEYRDTLEGDALSGVLFFEDRVEGMSLTADGRSFRLSRCRTKLIPDLSDGVKFTLRVRAEAMFLGPASAVSEDELIRAEEILKERVRECCEAALDRSVRGNGCDILGMGDVVWRTQPELFRTLSSEWPAAVRDLELDYDIQVTVNRFQEN